MKPLLKLSGITKSFEKQLVLDRVNLIAKRGKVTCLIGENAAGKSTLVKILAGIIRADEGQILLDGQPIEIDSIIKAYQTGIHVISHEIDLIKSISVAQNIFLSNELSHAIPFVKKGTMNQKAKELLIMLGSDIDVTKKVSALTHADYQMVLLARALVHESRLIIFDEPTCDLFPSEVGRLFAAINHLKSMGHTFLYITHNADEALKIADDVYILHNGRTEYSDANKADKSIAYERIVNAMAGQDFKNRYPHFRHKIGTVVFEVKDLHDPLHIIKPTSLFLQKGEIVGIAGLQGAGKTRLADLICGVIPKSGGETFLYGNPINILSPTDALKKGIAYLSERIEDNLFLPYSSEFNITVSNLELISRRGFISPGLRAIFSNKYKILFNISTENQARPISTLNSGSIQKIALAKLLFTQCSVLILDNPTKNMDIASKIDFYNIICNLSADQRLSILLISSDINELVGLCDRVLVMNRGKIIGEIPRKDTTTSKILHYVMREENISENA